MIEKLTPDATEDLPIVRGVLDSTKRRYRGKFVQIKDGGVAFFGDEKTKHKTIVDSPDEIFDALKAHPDSVATVNGFDFDQALQHARSLGPIIEVAGPTPKYRMRPIRGMKIGEMLVSNIVPRTHARRFDPNPAVNYQANALHLPHPNESVGGIFVSDFDPTKQEKDDDPKMLEEFDRILRPGGLAILQGISLNQLNFGIEMGFEPMTMQLVAVQPDRPDKPGETLLWGILHKPDIQT